jgi:tetratricopeptide (TPR) repeat protein
VTRERRPEPNALRALAIPGEARVWEIATSRPLAPPLPVMGLGSHARLSPDGRRLLVVSVGAIQTARLWEASTGQPLTPPWRLPPSALLEAGRDPRLYVLAAGYTGPDWDLTVPEGSPEDQARLVHFLSARDLDATGNPVPLEVGAYRRDWIVQHRRAPEQFTLLEREEFTWQEQQAMAAVEARDVHGALWHLQRVPGPSGERGMRLTVCGRLALQLGRVHEACALFEQAAAAGSESWEGWAVRAGRFAARGQWDRARADLDRALAGKGAPPSARLERAVVSLQLGELASGRQALTDLLVQAARGQPGRTVGQDHRREQSSWLRSVAGTALCVPDAVPEPGRLAELLGKSVEESSRVEVLRLQGMALYRAGKYAEAGQAFKRATELKKEIEVRQKQPGSGPHPLEGLFLAMVHHHLNQTGEARDWLDRTTKWLDEAPAARALHWVVALQTRLVRQEAETLLGVSNKP